MRAGLCVLVAAMALVAATSAGAQTDSLVVDSSGFVGVGTASPTESVQVVAALEPSFVELPSRCMRNIPVRILIVDAETHETLVMEEAFLNATSPVLRAELPADGVDGATVQVGVLTRPTMTMCVTAETTAVGPLGEIRKLDC